MKDVFISYCSENEKQAEKIHDLLEKNGFSCWYAPVSIRGTEDFTAVIPKAIREAKVFLLLLSKDAQESRWVVRELGTADELKMPIYTVFLEECTLNDSFGFMLKFSQHYDMTSGVEEQTKRLLRELKEDLHKAEPECGEEKKPAPKKKKGLFIGLAAAVVVVAALVLALIFGMGGMKDGRYVLWNPAYGMALTGNEVNGHYHAGEVVAHNGDKLTGYSSDCVWEVAFDSQATFTLRYGEETLGVEPGYNGIGLGGEYTADRWVLEKAGDGLYYIRNKETGFYLEWFEEKENWATYNKMNDTNRDLFRVRLDEVG